MADLGVLKVGAGRTGFIVTGTFDDSFFTSPIMLGNNVKRVRRSDSLKALNDVNTPLSTFFLGCTRMVTDFAPDPKRTISGITRKLGVNTSGLLVKVFSRDGGVLLGSALSGAGGAYSVDILGYSGECTVVAYDVSLTPENASVVDNVTPV